MLRLHHAPLALAGKLPALANLDQAQQKLLARPALGVILAEEMQLRAKA